MPVFKSVAVLVTVLLALFSFSSTAAAANNSTTTTPIPPAAATFYLTDTQTQFSVNIANDSSDVYFYFASTAYSWVGVGFGSQMENSLMLIMYPDSSGNNLTISPRIGRQAGEPVFTKQVEIEVLTGTRIEDDMMILHARCSDCRVWPNGFLDATSRSQPMMYAFGSPYTLQSSSPSADLKRHVRYGHFNMDMTTATGAGGVPFNSSALSGVEMVGSMQKDADVKTFAHALLGCVVLFAVWPINQLIAGFLKNIRIHVVFSLALIVCLGVVYGLGIATSNQYNRSKTYSTPHQILALISLLPLLLLSLLPLPPLSSLSPLLPRLHTPLPTLTLALLLLSGGLGLHLSQQTRSILLVYTALSVLVLVFCTSLAWLIRRRGSAHARATKRLPLPSSAAASASELGLLGRETGKFGVGRRSESETGSATSLKGFLDESRRDAGSEGQRLGSGHGQGQAQRNMFGGGTMPGPQYLLNMHPGVPVNLGGGRTI